MKTLIAKKPWILIFAALALLLSGWATLITLVVKNPTAFVAVVQTLPVAR